ncbi:HAMP domain-containing protein [Streptomyces sp. yr375]|uniref:HAMP domain-containing protein n=1 Tax=Streptomyces sp. yr375 TaxID=1761906 RepID=UPI0008AED7DE|nr:HAMP domain-containing protein [Streptomyces sp. yr375]SES34823.1 HAMP domain-containing protein [Streptomyces sp. yr375]
MLYVQRPLLRLHREARRLASGDLGHRVAVRTRGETGRIAGALESLRHQLHGDTAESESEPRTYRAPGVLRGPRAVVVCCAALIVAWGVALPLLTSFAVPDRVPAQAEQDQKYRTQAAADRIRRTLSESVADLSSIARLTAGGGTRVDEVLDDELTGHDGWSSLYLVDAAGKMVAHAGKTSLDIDRKAALAGVKPGAPAVLQLNRSGKVPAAAAAVPVGDGTRRLVTELRADVFNGVLTRSGIGRSWLVDARGRIIASNQGFIAFSSPPKPGANTLTATAAITSAPPARPAAQSSARTRDTVAVDTLGWRVVTHKPVAWLRLAGYETARHAELAGLLALAAALLGLGWLWLTVLRPLRALDRSATALAAGDRTTVIYPQHHDEVGSVARSLELIRQRLAAADRKFPATADGQ